MQSVADIWNMALGHVGVADEVNDPDNDTIKEATACRRFWASARDQVLRDFPWPRLAVMEALTLAATDPIAQWGYSYRLPANVARIIRVFVANSPRLDNSSTRIPYELGRDATSELLFADFADLQIKYTYLETSTSRYPADVAAAMALLLAAMISARFGPEAVKLGDRALKLYSWRIASAQSNAGNEEQVDIATDSDFERSRDG